MWMVRVSDKGKESVFKMMPQSVRVWRWRPKYINVNRWEYRTGMSGGWTAVAPTVTAALSMIENAQTRGEP